MYCCWIREPDLLHELGHHLMWSPQCGAPRAGILANGRVRLQAVCVKRVITVWECGLRAARSSYFSEICWKSILLCEMGFLNIGKFVS